MLLRTCFMEKFRKQHLFKMQMSPQCIAPLSDLRSKKQRGGGDDTSQASSIIQCFVEYQYELLCVSVNSLDVSACRHRNAQHVKHPLNSGFPDIVPKRKPFVWAWLWIPTWENPQSAQHSGPPVISGFLDHVSREERS